MMRKSKSGRDIIDRYNELKEEYENLSEIPDEDDFETPEEFQDACDEQVERLAEWIDAEEYEDLKRVIDDINEDCFLIHEDEFEEYTQELVEDLYGEIPDFIVVDWEATADAVKMGYTSIEIGSDTFYYRP